MRRDLSELETRTHPIPPGQAIDPPPPADLKWVRFVSGLLPDKTRDGRDWQQDGKASPYAKLWVTAEW